MSIKDMFKEKLGSLLEEIDRQRKLYSEEQVEEAVGTAAKYAGEKSLFGKKYNSKDAILNTNSPSVIGYAEKKRKQREDEHEKQDPKHKKAGYAKHMVDTLKARRKAAKRGVTAEFDWKTTNGIAKGKLPENLEAEGEADQINEFSADYLRRMLNKKQRALAIAREKRKASGNPNRGRKEMELQADIDQHRQQMYAAQRNEEVEQMDEDADSLMKARSLYAQTYAKNCKTAKDSKPAMQAGYDAVEKKHGTEMMNRVKAWHKKFFQPYYTGEPMDEVAPPGREDQVKALKKKVGVKSAFKIAWSSYNKGKR